MEDIAKACGLSKMTVSRVLHNKQYGVSESARKRILDCAKRFNYVPNSLARNFASMRSGYIGLALPFEGLLGSTYFARLVTGIQVGLQGSEWQLGLFDTQSETFNDGDKVAGLYHQRRVDGLIAIAPHSHESFIEKLSEADVPVIIAGEPTLNRDVLSVSMDEEKCVETLVGYLVAKDHQQIGFIEGPEDLLSAKMRKASYLKAMAKHGLEVSQDWLLKGDYDRKKTRKEALNFIKRPKLPTAIIAANDLMGLGFLDAAMVTGIKVPTELSIVGIDDFVEAETCFPPLTTMHQPVKKMGQAAAEHLLRWIESDTKPDPISPLNPYLVERQSVTTPNCSAKCLKE
jgi:DNA-binding LacI/PurR family transcriptional regulator